MARWGEALAWAKEAAVYKGDDCLLWPFSTTRGYGTAWNGKKTVPASRLVCELAHGAPFMIWNQAAHRCGNRLCCNPLHIRWTTRRENEADKRKHGTSNRGERHGLAILTEADVLTIRRERKRGIPRATLAREYNIKPTTVYEITSGRRWAWLKGEEA